MGSLDMAKEKSLGLMGVNIQAPGLWIKQRVLVPSHTLMEM